MKIINIKMSQIQKLVKQTYKKLRKDFLSQFIHEVADKSLSIDELTEIINSLLTKTKTKKTTGWALFCKESKHSKKECSKIWKDMSQKEKNKWIKRAKNLKVDDDDSNTCGIMQLNEKLCTAKVIEGSERCKRHQTKQTCSINECLRIVKEDDLCKKHLLENSQQKFEEEYNICQGKTKKGTSCKLKVNEGKYCKKHNNYKESSEIEDTINDNETLSDSDDNNSDNEFEENDYTTFVFNGKKYLIDEQQIAYNLDNKAIGFYNEEDDTIEFD